MQRVQYAGEPGTGAAVGRAPRRGRRPMTDRERERHRLEISRAAIRLFGEHGVHRTSGDQIAAAVGLSARTLWRYFRTKESCVEPVLRLTSDGFLECLRLWPGERTLTEHIVAHYRDEQGGHASDRDAAFSVIRMSREEPALRAIWLVVNERAEPVLAEIIAGRLGVPADDVAVRVQAAALNAAVRIASEDIAIRVADPAGQWGPEDLVTHLSTAVRAATTDVLR